MTGGRALNLKRARANKERRRKARMVRIDVYWGPPVRPRYPDDDIVKMRY